MWLPNRRPVEHADYRSLDDKAIRFDKEEIEQSLYANFSCPIEGFGKVEIVCS